MKLSIENCVSIAKNIIKGQVPEFETLAAIAETRDEDVFNLVAGAGHIRDFFFKKQIHLCTICNAKSGKCSEDCSFCSQSGFHNADIQIYPLMSKKELARIPTSLSDSPVNRFSFVTGGRGLPPDEVDAIADAISDLAKTGLSFCASLGILQDRDFETLKKAGVTRYHHNLETAPSHFQNVCTTHSFEDRVQTIQRAKKAGLEICSGGIFGIGETDSQALELALELKRLDVDAVPLNFLAPIPGTRMAEVSDLTPLRCLKIIALFRYVLPDKDIFICGGRQLNLKRLESFMFQAGASGLMTGNYLTTRGARLDQDLELLDQLFFTPRVSRSSHPGE